MQYFVFSYNLECDLLSSGSRCIEFFIRPDFLSLNSHD
ncbi:hypothetical protein LEP1GSC018_3975 [Leptospira kirschneri str. 2008720114]|nr:hypothetical protein LEP1GSC018_3975 [Leptospira kirschneri str. 2008720114]EMN24486.1 hypothetical protein LEP1GSC065_2345 [Leptospira kirschneri serovar Sokoine str. RM1]